MMPQLPVSLELTRFAQSLLLGIPAGLLLDLFRTLRALLPHHPLTVFLEDALYTFLLCFLLQCFVWMYADTALRWQYALGELIGLAVYLLTAGTVWGRVLRRVCAIRQKIRRIFVKNTEKETPAEKIAEST
ncbi:MAG: spore cortex biosynthesis protein YabQ [Oscillospiraceae bacterium]|nr:spore cortex biosynthesis protein YabQ [Oscillospiraceae bacterium]